MTRMEVFENLSKDNGLNIQVTGHVYRAWFGDKDFIMGLNNNKDYPFLEIATKVIHGKFMLFQQHKNVSKRAYNKLNEQIKQLIGEFKDYQVNEKLGRIKNDF